MTGAPVPTFGDWSPRRFGTQDHIHLDPSFPWKPGEIAALQAEIALRSGRPLRRVQYVVSKRARFEGPLRTWAARWRSLPGIVIYIHEYVGSTRCGNRTDWMICRAATEMLAPLERSWQMRRLAALKIAADANRLPLRVRRGTGWGHGHRYRGLYTSVAEQLGQHPSYVRDVGLGKKADDEILQALFSQVSLIDNPTPLGASN